MHSSIKPVWKYSWRPEGYGLETIEMDTSSSPIGTLITFDHTFFRGLEFSAQLASGTSLTIGYENAALTGKEDLILRAYDAKLSQLCNSGIYRAVEIGSSRARAKKLLIKINFIADAIDPADFGQSLNPQADVIHKSLTAEKITSNEAVIENVIAEKSTTGTWGAITPDKVTLTADSIEAAGIQFTRGTCTLKDPLILETSKGKLRYNPEILLWEVWNSRSNRYVPITISHEAVEDIPEGGIAVVSGDDKAAQCYQEGFFLKNSELNVPSIKTDAGTFTKDRIDLQTSEILWNGHTLRTLSDGTLDIDNLLQVNNTTGTVRIGNVTFNKALLSVLQKLVKKDAE